MPIWGWGEKKERLSHYNYSTGAALPLVVLLLTWRLTILLPQKSLPLEDEELNNLTAANIGVSQKHLKMEQEYGYQEQLQRQQEMTPFNGNVIMQTPVRSPSISEPPPPAPPEPEDHDVLY